MFLFPSHAKQYKDVITYETEVYTICTHGIMPKVLQCAGCQKTMLTTTYGMVHHLAQECPNTTLQECENNSIYKAQLDQNKCPMPASEPTTRSAIDVKMPREAAT